MSIANEIARLQQAKADLKDSINAKGGTITDETIDEYAGKIDEITTGSGGLTGGYNVVYRSNYFSQIFSWISITLTFVDDTTASYEIKTSDGNFPSDWEHYTGNEYGNGEMIFTNAGPYIWNNVKSVSITAHAFDGEPYLEINGVDVGSTYNETLNSNILVHNAGGTFG